jgi:hypothetical protein
MRLLGGGDAPDPSVARGFFEAPFFLERAMSEAYLLSVPSTAQTANALRELLVMIAGTARLRNDKGE